MSFTTKQIQPQTLCIIDIGSFKIRLCAAKFKNKDIEILGYTEKRQDTSYFSNQECKNLPGLCENISWAIEKLESKISFPLENIVVNYPFGELFLGSKTLNYKRKNTHDSISVWELERIMEKTEHYCVNSFYKDIEKLYWLRASDIQVLLSRVNHIYIDTKYHPKVIWKTWEHVNISLLNAFVPESKYRQIIQLGKVIKKEIFRVLPIEYCITKAFPDKNIVLVNVWATQTTLSIICENKILWISKIPIWIHDLVNKIQKQHDITQVAILETISIHSLYNDEKTAFLDVWGDALWHNLKEILGTSICPDVFFIGWWGANNDFIRSYIKNFAFSDYNIKIIKKVSFEEVDMWEILQNIKHVKIDDIGKISLDMYAMLLEVNTILSWEHDAISNSLQNAVNTLGYTKN